MAPTSAPAVKSALVTALGAAGPLAGVRIDYTHPGVEMPQEAVWFNKTISHEEARAFGNKKRDENYTLELIVNVARDGNNGEVAELRCWEIVEACENVVRANPGKAGDVMEHLVVGHVVWAGAEMTPAIENGQRVSECVCRVGVLNRK